MIFSYVQHVYQGRSNEIVGLGNKGPNRILIFKLLNYSFLNRNKLLLPEFFNAHTYISFFLQTSRHKHHINIKSVSHTHRSLASFLWTFGLEMMMTFIKFQLLAFWVESCQAHQFILLLIILCLKIYVTSFRVSAIQIKFSEYLFINKGCFYSWWPTLFHANMLVSQCLYKYRE